MTKQQLCHELHLGTGHAVVLAILLLTASDGRTAPPDVELSAKARTILERHCHRCHGKDGTLEGGMNYILDRDKLVARRKLLPGDPARSPLLKRIVDGRMPPPDVSERPDAEEIQLLTRWIAQGAQFPASTAAARPLRTDADIYLAIREDLEKHDKRSRRFLRYFSLAPQYNRGLSADELQTYRNALAKLLNSLSWHPRITLPAPIDKESLVFRIDLRDFLWDAPLWNRMVQDYPYALLHESAVARAALIGTASRVPVIRIDWFLSTASRAPLYYDLLQIPNNSAELERQLRVDVTLNIQQERVARLGFNGSGVSRNNRILERHYSSQGVYWRTYDFDAVPQNLVERDLLLPDRRNAFAYPLGPGGTDNTFQHAGGEIIFSLPNGLHAFMLVNADNNRIDKGPQVIVSDPRRPDRAVEAGVSCMSCHVTGILPKSDQIREHVQKNRKQFSRKDLETILALYPPEAKMSRLMEEDAERYREALARTGNRVRNTEPVSTLTLQYESDLDLGVAASELGLSSENFRTRVQQDATVARNLGGLLVPGGTVSRQVFIQAYGDLVRSLRLGTVFLSGATGQSLPDNTGEVDPLEGSTNEVNAASISADGKRILLASADKSIRLWDVEGRRDLRRFIGHTASVWSVAFSPDNQRALSGSADQTVRLWDVATGQELLRLEGHANLVHGVAFSADGKLALSLGFDHVLILWDLELGKEIGRLQGELRHLHAFVVSPDNRQIILAADRALHTLTLPSLKIVHSLETGSGDITALKLSRDGKLLLTGGDDGRVTLLEAGGKRLRSFSGHDRPVKTLSFSPDERQIISASSDASLRLWDVETGKELRRFNKHATGILASAFRQDGSATLSVSSDGNVLVWELPRDRAGQGTAPAAPPRNTIDVTPSAVFRPTKRLFLPGAITNLFVTPDGQWLHVFSAEAQRIYRFSARTYEPAGEIVVPTGAETMAQSPNGKRLAVLAPGDQSSTILVVDASDWKPRPAFTFAENCFDLALDNQGRVYLSGARPGWAEVVVLSWKGQLLTRWGGVWSRSFLSLTPDEKHLLVGTQGVQPGSVDSFAIPRDFKEKPVLARSPARESHPLGGECVVSSDSQWILQRSGIVLKGGASPQHLSFDTKIPAFLAAVDHAERKVGYLSTEAGELLRYEYPTFRIEKRWRLSGPGYRLAVCSQKGTLFVATFDPAQLTRRGSLKKTGEIQIFEFRAEK